VLVPNFRAEKGFKRQSACEATLYCVTVLQVQKWGNYFEIYTIEKSSSVMMYGDASEYGALDVVERKVCLAKPLPPAHNHVGLVRLNLKYIH
jgi:hypothetical protein